MRCSEQEKRDFDQLAAPYLSNPKVQSMQGFIQHGRITTLDHVMSVSTTAFLLNRRWKWQADESILVPACLLHDFYLYDWHQASIRVPLFQMHGFTHPGKACEEAVKEFDIDEQVQKAIKSHMWPLNLTTPPASKEAWLLCIADKLCALKETVLER